MFVLDDIVVKCLYWVIIDLFNVDIGLFIICRYGFIVKFLV